MVNNPCADCSLCSSDDDLVCLWCPSNPYPYDDHFDVHQL